MTKYGNISRSDGKLYVEIIGEKEEKGERGEGRGERGEKEERAKNDEAAERCQRERERVISAFFEWRSEKCRP